MKHLKLFAALCCTAALFAACDKTDEPTNNGQQETTNPTNGHEYVDLGLPSGLKWATMNVGAIAPEAYGDYYAWGETAPKKNYDWNTYKHCTYYWHPTDAYGKGGWRVETLIKYNTRSSYGTVDNLTTLEAEDDAAVQNWGGKWRIPTDEEWAELYAHCDWTLADDYNGTGVAGRIVTSKINGNSIFLPAAGYRQGDSMESAGDFGGYWSSSLYEDEPFPYYAWFMACFSDDVLKWPFPRSYGASVRPVLK